MFGKNKSKYLSYLPLVLGICCLLYPMVSDFINKKELADIIANQHEQVVRVCRDENKLEDKKSQALKYNEILKSSMSTIVDPFDPDQVVITHDDYDSLLNIAGDSVMATLIIPTIGVQMPVYHGVSDEVLQKGIGHIHNTSLPIGGKSSHCVLTGHTGLPAMRILDRLTEMKIGDIFIIDVLDERHAYEVYDIEEVEPSHTESLSIKDDEDLCTLVTCTPFGVNTKRLLVHGRRCEVPEAYKDADIVIKNDLPSYLTQSSTQLIPFSIAGIVAGVVVVLGVGKIQEKRKLTSTSHKPAHFK